MQLPDKLPGLRLLTVLLAGYFALWISLEGDLTQTVILAVGSCVLAAAHLIQRWGRGRVLAGWFWLIGMTLTGLLVGVSTIFATLAFMAVKTGLHAHGPEFTPSEIAWVWNQLPLWTIIGTLTSLGLASLILGMKGSR
ncbi:MAG: hypothetical protein IPL78_07995 [Chloroflexi bacterium]|nr:hypothetical protein [Chloroflexota bacterium]